ncbi:transcription antitermination factor NusB [Bdellovibrionota bacterium FG-1]
MGYPRDLAVRVLTRVLSDHEPLDEALIALANAVPPSDRAWLQEVCSGTLRWRGRLDRAVDSTAIKKKPSGWLRKVLLIAAYQLVVQERTSPAAVVNETVNEVKRKEGEAPAKFANAALRKIAEHGVAWRELKLKEGASTLDGSGWASLPEWLWKRLCATRGEEWARAYALASLDRPKLWVRAKSADFKADWAVVGPVVGSFEVTEGGGITSKSGFAEGHFFVQDISSQKLIAEITARIQQQWPEGFAEGAVRRALDLCAAPGGKAVGLSWSGWSVSASDRDAARYALLRNTIERVAPEIQVIERNQVGELPLLDLVWVDAPCSGTGILRRHPDVRWLRQERELEGLMRVQQELLAEAWDRVRPGGFLVYSVCSVLKEEGEQALKKFMEGRQAQKLEQWFLAPQEAPYGDGFWAGLIQK